MQTKRHAYAIHYNAAILFSFISTFVYIAQYGFIEPVVGMVFFIDVNLIMSYIL